MRPITGTGSARNARGERFEPTGARCSGGREPALGIVSSGSAPEPIWLAQSHDLDREAGAAAATAGRQGLGQGRDLGLRAGEQPQRRQALGQPVGVAVEPQRRLERREADLVEAHARASSGCG